VPTHALAPPKSSLLLLFSKDNFRRFEALIEREWLSFFPAPSSISNPALRTKENTPTFLLFSDYTDHATISSFEFNAGFSSS
jgi:hypothetical protein